MNWLFEWVLKMLGRVHVGPGQAFHHKGQAYLSHTTEIKIETDGAAWVEAWLPPQMGISGWGWLKIFKRLPEMNGVGASRLEWVFVRSLTWSAKTEYEYRRRFMMGEWQSERKPAWYLMGRLKGLVDGLEDALLLVDRGRSQALEDVAEAGEMVIEATKDIMRLNGRDIQGYRGGGLIGSGNRARPFQLTRGKDPEDWTMVVLEDGEKVYIHNRYRRL